MEGEQSCFCRRSKTAIVVRAPFCFSLQRNTIRNPRDVRKRAACKPTTYISPLASNTVFNFHILPGRLIKLKLCGWIYCVDIVVLLFCFVREKIWKNHKKKSYYNASKGGWLLASYAYSLFISRISVVVGLVINAFFLPNVIKGCHCVPDVSAFLSCFSLRSAGVVSLVLSMQSYNNAIFELFFGIWCLLIFYPEATEKSCHGLRVELIIIIESLIYALRCLCGFPGPLQNR